MRVTQTIIARNLLSSVNLARKNMDDEQASIASGKRIRKSSDDPLKFSRSTQFKNAFKRNEQYLRNIEDAQVWAKTSSDAMDDLYSSIVRAKEIAIQGADVVAADTRQALADQVEDLITESLASGNTTHLDRYLFGGTVTKNTAPFSYDGTAVTYNGNSAAISRRISDSRTMGINVTGDDILTGDVFSSLIELRDALIANDTNAIRTALTSIAGAEDEVLSFSADLGAIDKQLKMTKNHLETANINLSSYVSQTEDTDMLEAIANYNQDEMAYRAALQATSRSLQLNIMDFLR